MMCFKDITFCSFYKLCTDGSKCHRALTHDVKVAAVKWWGNDDAPISLFVDPPECMTKIITVWERFDEKSESFKHNHIADGWGSDKMPVAESDIQKKSWKNAKWRCTFTHLKGGKIIEVKKSN